MDVQFLLACDWDQVGVRELFCKKLLEIIHSLWKRLVLRERKKWRKKCRVTLNYSKLTFANMNMKVESMDGKLTYMANLQQNLTSHVATLQAAIH